ncbi:hypothetical protein BASA81_006603 [Batrachochytrium salamandrivorans]|nr:hypothetical protein BASA81_008526 [Batrachochytrium salamandrivorans]KAH9255163.1 hypothetical protein BASA81_006603 [Batrachochytrium salamandrivorans]
MIPRAVEIARSKSVPFANASTVLRASQINSKPKPVVFTTSESFHKQQLICDPLGSEFLFHGELAGGCKVRELYTTPYCKFIVLENDSPPPERKQIGYRELANTHVNNPLQMSYLAHVAGFLDQLYNVSYCHKCGSALVFPSQYCAKCQAQRYARVSPCAMVLVHDGQGSVLLCRHPSKDYWGLVAGFCEVGESVEQCGVRECWEEVGVRVQSDPTLAVTQPWPFPRPQYEGTSLMVGMFAEAKSNSPGVLDGKEVAEAEWVHASQVHQRKLPGPASLSRLMIDSFVEALL